MPAKRYNLFFLFIIFLFSFNPAYSNNTLTSTPDEIFMSGEYGTPIKLEARIDVPMELNLEQALKLALLQNLDITLAKNQRDLDKWKLWENLSHYLPNYSLGVTNQRFDGTFLVGGVFAVMSLTSNVNAYMRFDYPFFQGGKGFFNTLAANKIFKSSKENLSASMKDVLLFVTKAYNQLLREQAQLDVLAKSFEEAKAVYKLNQNLEKQGAGTTFDVLQSEAQLAEQEQLFIAQQANFRDSAINLSRLLNLEQSAHIRPSQKDLTAKKLFNIDKPIGEILKVAFDNRTEIKKAKLEYNAQRNYIAAAYSGFLPSANFYGQYGGTGHVFFHRTKVSEVIPDAIALDASGNPVIQMVSRSRFLDQTDLSNITSVSNVIKGAGSPFLSSVDDSLMASRFIGIQVGWNLAEGLGLTTLSKINQARNQAKLYSVNIVKINQQIEQEVRLAYLKAQTTEKLLEVAVKRINAAGEALRLAKLRLQNGVGINTELLGAQKQHSESLGSQVNAIVDYNNAQADLLHSLGLISIESLTRNN
ncbi:MAG: hypothetical protein A3I68_08835 [Candidatus Melainabacteria bacterium RIFCSPLOWO2_02_FULL_35_15]|nr:MAG: hypothetical protein A3F80_07005 [Candidatus Melainabacteria bacterium RIFCSPLOWO2_12_FULL_35_11]OGI14070.1 MAG: hypothetical protein A3I68_08835 [Candidatus Melainabacteria bacterium RIFCSPLOWO2_02_FULL_35_15]